MLLGVMTRPGISACLALSHSFFCWRVSSEQSSRCQLFRIKHVLLQWPHGLEAPCRAGQLLLEGNIGAEQSSRCQSFQINHRLSEALRLGASLQGWAVAAGGVHRQRVPEQHGDRHRVRLGRQPERQPGNRRRRQRLHSGCKS